MCLSFKKDALMIYPTQSSVNLNTFAICDMKDDEKSIDIEKRDSLSESDDDQRLLDYRMIQSFISDDYLYYLSNLDIKRLNIFSNKNKWWHTGSTTYGYGISNFTEEAISKLFKRRSEPLKNKLCPICLDDLMADLVSLKGCLHVYHRLCFTEYVMKVKKPRVLCPLCSTTAISGNGPSPPGKMSWILRKDILILNEETIVNTIEIKYKLKSGRQLIFHPHPGKFYKGIIRKSYLPVTSDYILILRMLILAFMDGQTFTIEQDQKIGEDVIAWNGIEHKINVAGGITNCGFPDKNYKKRIIDNLNSKGILHEHNL